MLLPINTATQLFIGIEYMDTKPTNPLAKHFRQPSVYIKLPSNGRYWGTNSLDLPVTGEIPVFPMTNADEITLKTPDALMNGTSIVSVIQSCCPNITDAWNMPTTDVDTILMSIRIASYGPSMTVTAKCPKCGEEHDYDIELQSVLSGVKFPNYDQTVNYHGLKIKLRPQKYFGATQSNIVQYEEQRIAQALSNTDISDEERNVRLKQSMIKLLDLNEQVLVDSTEYIETEDGTLVDDPAFIKEFYKNADGAVTRDVEKRLLDISTEGALPLTNLSCTSCQHEYSVPMEFDYSSFFAQGS